MTEPPRKKVARGVSTDNLKYLPEPRESKTIEYIDSIYDFTQLDIKQLNSDNPAVIWRMKKNGTLDVKKIYFMRGEQSMTLLTYAIGFGKYKISEALVLLKSDINGDPGTVKPICLVAENGLTRAIEFLDKHGYSRTSFNGLTLESPIYCALCNNHINCYDLLLKQGCSLTMKNIDDEGPIDIALKIGSSFQKNIDYMRMFLPLEDLIKSAIRADDLEYLKKLRLSNQWEDIDHVLPGLITFSPISFSVYQEKPRICKWLIDCGANLEMIKRSSNITTDTYSPPVHLAIIKNNPDILEILANGGASLTTPDDVDGISPAFYATCHGYYDCLRVLYKHKVPLYCEDASGDNNLDIALERGHIKCTILIMSWLLENTFRDIAKLVDAGKLQEAKSSLKSIKEGCSDLGLSKMITIYSEKYSDLIDIIENHSDGSISSTSSSPILSPKHKKQKKQKKSKCLICNSNSQEFTIVHNDGERHKCICFDCMINLKMQTDPLCPICNKTFSLFCK
jgi:ankyrin repeat protein